MGYPLTQIDPDPHAARLLARDLKTLAVFIDIYCTHQHKDAQKSLSTLKTHDVTAIRGRPLHLCPDCQKMLAHALTKRSRCPMDPKPQCKHCPNHCYAPAYREKIRHIMRFSGKKMVLGGRLDYLWHLYF